MSVEERLRQAYRDDESASETSLVTSYGAVVRGSSRRHRHRTIAGGLVLCVAALVAVVAVLSAVGPPDDVQPAPPGPIVTGTAGDLMAGGLGGTWRSLPMTRAQVIQGLRDEGFAKYAVDYARSNLPRGDFRVHLRLDEEEVSVRIGDREPRTSHVVRVESNEIELRPKEARAGSSTLSWALNGGALFFSFESTTLDPPVTSEVFPAGVYDVATYGLATFTRVE